MNQLFSQHHVSLFMIASAVSYGATQIVKPFLWRLHREKSKALIRLCAVIMGAIVGYTVDHQVLCLWIGAGAGVFNATTVGIISHKVKQRYGDSAKEPSASKEQAQREDS